MISEIFAKVRFGFVFVEKMVDHDGWEHNEWIVSLGYGEKNATFSYRTGLSLTYPMFEDVVFSLRGDTYAAEYSFKEWCAEYGYDNDSISALKVYNECRSNTLLLQGLFGDDYEWFIDSTREMMEVI